MSATSGQEGPLRLGRWNIDPGTGTVEGEHRTTHLAPQTLAVLEYLLERPGVVVSTQELLDDVWPGRVVGDDSIHQQFGNIMGLNIFLGLGGCDQ